MNKLERIKQGIKDMTPLQSLQVQIVGTTGTIVGIILAWFVMLFKGLWYWSILLFFTVVLQVNSLIQIKKSYDNMKEMLELSNPNPQEVVEGVQQSHSKDQCSDTGFVDLNELWR